MASGQTSRPIVNLGGSIAQIAIMSTAQVCAAARRRWARVQSADVPQIRTGDPSSLPHDVIDTDVFGQLLEMDEEDDREFSKSLVWNYFEQAESTFEKMNAALCVLLRVHGRGTDPVAGRRKTSRSSRRSATFSRALRQP